MVYSAMGGLRNRHSITCQSPHQKRTGTFQRTLGRFLLSPMSLPATCTPSANSSRSWDRAGRVLDYPHSSIVSTLGLDSIPTFFPE